MIYALGTVFKAIFTRQFSDNLIFTKHQLRNGVDGIVAILVYRIHPHYWKLYFQVQFCLITQYIIRHFIIGEEKVFNIYDILTEASSIHFNSLIFHALVEKTQKVLSCIWITVKEKLCSETKNIVSECEFNICWRLQLSKTFSVTEIFEVLHYLIGLISAVLFAYYSSNANNLYSTIHKWIDLSTYYPSFNQTTRQPHILYHFYELLHPPLNSSQKVIYSKVILSVFGGSPFSNESSAEFNEIEECEPD